MGRGWAQNRDVEEGRHPLGLGSPVVGDFIEEASRDPAKAKPSGMGSNGKGIDGDEAQCRGEDLECKDHF